MAKSYESIVTGFGVELEFTFPFRQDLLVNVLSSAILRVIILSRILT